MALASFDGDFSFSQESIARLGDRAGSSKLTEEQQKQLKQSKAFQAQLRLEELLKEYSEERDKKRVTLDQSFTPDDADFSAAKAYDYDRSTNYYEILGIDEYAPLDEVNRAYKRLSLVYHPDKTKGMSAQQQEDYETIFISVKNAHLVLGDQPTRRQYDKDRDQDKAKEVVSGVKAPSSQHVDLTEVLKRISEMQRPPGKVVEVQLELELEQFFYGAHKAVSRDRRIKDFYAGMINQEHVYRFHVPRGARDPLELTFKEQGDHNPDTRPDTVKFRITARPHAVVTRQEGDLLRPEEIQLSAGSLAEAYFTAQVPGLRGRRLLVWGRNPFHSSWRSQPPSTETRLVVAVRGEGMDDEGCLRFTCKFRAPDTPAAFSSQTARQFLKEMLSASEALQEGIDGEPYWTSFAPVAEAAQVATDPESIRRAIGAALQAIPGEWALIAKCVKLLQRGLGTSMPSLQQFLQRHKLGSESLGDDKTEFHCRQDAQGSQHGSHSKRKSKQLSVKEEILLRPLGEVMPLFTKPHSSITFYSNMDDLTQEQDPGTTSAVPVFAVCLASAACATPEAEADWKQLEETLLPLLEASIFQLMPAARSQKPLCIADFAAAATSAASEAAGSAPWRRLGAASFRRSDFWLAAHYYTRWMVDVGSDPEQAVALSNRAACFAKVGDFLGSLEDARAAKELRPDWARTWARVGFAAQNLGQDYLEEAFQAYRQAVELDPSRDNLQGLAQVALELFSGRQAEEYAQGNASWASESFGQAVACYTIALATHPAKLPVAEMEAFARKEEELVDAESRINAEENFREATKKVQQATSSEDMFNLAALYANRAAALCHLRCWDAAVQDAQMAAQLQREWPKARCRLGVSLLGAGRPEEAYVQFAWALAFDSHSAVARQGLEACLTAIPRWRHRRAAQSRRLEKDRIRPRDSTKVWVVSDLYFDAKSNAEWCNALDDAKFQDDVLIVAGNVADTLHSIIRGLKVLRSKFHRLFYVPGNRDLALNASEVRTARFPDSIAKLLGLLAACDQIGVDMFPAAISQDVYVVPLHSWYNAEFDKKSRPDPNHGFDAQCVWPLDPNQLWKWMLKLNEVFLKPLQGTVLTCSHFVPLTTLPFDGLGKQAQAMGCEEIEDQLRRVRSAGHAYGHASIRTCQVHGGVTFLNHALGVLEDSEAVPSPRLLFDGHTVVT
ncbi:sti1 [Symbiodinium sp. CCMP2592]|nr:sti1 [Symbiodinium sp. CCMP2592]